MSGPESSREDPNSKFPECEALRRLVSIMRKLRSPDHGCPWDKQQTHESLRPFVIEEAYEVVEAVDLGSPRKLREELGDLLLQVVFHAELARERGLFDLHDIIRSLNEKLVRRHPHVFGNVVAEDVPAVMTNWYRIKEIERQGEPGDSKGPGDLFAGIPISLPALMLALKIQERAARLGFDWETALGPVQKIAEEARELEEVLSECDHERIDEELGDLLFAVVNCARLAGVDPELSLRRAVKKFRDRLEAMRALALERGKQLEGMSLREMDELWEEIKQKGI